VRPGSFRCWTRAAALAALLATALFTGSAARADDPTALRSEAERLRAESDGLAAQAQQALLDLYALESRHAQAERRLAAFQARQQDLEEREDAARRHLEIARSDLELASRRLDARLRTLYFEAEVDPLAILLGADSLDEALSALDGLGRVAAQDRSIAAQVVEARAALRDSLRSLQQHSSELRAVVAEAEAQRSAAAAARAGQADYLAGLESRHALAERQIQGLLAQAEAAEARAEDVTAGGGEGDGGAPLPLVPPAGPGTRMTVSSTGYCLRGTTATGIPVGWGVVAVDPAVIPLGTKMTVPGYGEGVAADTGGAVVGAAIDLWFPRCSQARAWGRKVVTITLH
jgi:3D (Asp-Asp-Asp) domain-containing protein